MNHSKPMPVRPYRHIFQPIRAFKIMYLPLSTVPFPGLDEAGSELE